MEVQLVPIPKLFKNDLTGSAFESCVKCECLLEDSQEGYMIEKAIKPYHGLETYSTIFEYAMCMSCAMEMRNELSAESRQRVDAYFEEHLNMEKRSKLLDAGGDWQELIQECAIHDTPVQEMKECQVLAHCVGEFMMIGVAPYLIGGAVSDEVIQLLSAKSLDDLNRFKEDLNDSPRLFKELLEVKKVFV